MPKIKTSMFTVKLGLRNGYNAARNLEAQWFWCKKSDGGYKTYIICKLCIKK